MRCRRWSRVFGEQIRGRGKGSFWLYPRDMNFNRSKLARAFPRLIAPIIIGDHWTSGNALMEYDYIVFPRVNWSDFHVASIWKYIYTDTQTRLPGEIFTAVVVNSLCLTSLSVKVRSKINILWRDGAWRRKKIERVNDRTRRVRHESRPV